MHRRLGLLSILNLRLARGRIVMLFGLIFGLFAVLRRANMRQVSTGGPAKTLGMGSQTTWAASRSGGLGVLFP